MKCLFPKDEVPVPPKPSARKRRQVAEEPVEDTHKEEEVKEIGNNLDEEEVDSAPVPVQADATADEDSFEARQAERRRRREQRQKDLEELSSAEKPISNGTDKPKSEETTANDAREKSPAEDSYEARKEARRKAREERLKAAAAKVEEKQEPRLSYRERKARESMQNAKDSRKKWENREDESGEK